MQLLVSHLQVDGENFNRVCGIRAKFLKQKIVILLRIERSTIQTPKNSDLELCFNWRSSNWLAYDLDEDLLIGVPAENERKYRSSD